MQKLIRAGFLLGLIFLMAGTAWALPIKTGDKITMSWTDNHPSYAPYSITNVDTSDKAVWSEYFSFCLESEIEFDKNTVYTVETVADYATSGGTDNDNPDDGKDYISNQTKWLFTQYASAGNPTLEYANDVQLAIWWLEDESDVHTAWTQNFQSEFISFKENNDLTLFLAEWDIKAVNMVDDNGNDIQSQLVGQYNPVPEPATMVLFGIGLLGIAGIGRKKINK